MLREVLEKLAKGEVSLEEAEMALRLLAVEDVADLARLDVGREIRHGAPEVVIADGKLPRDVARIAEQALTQMQRVIISRVSEDHLEALKALAMEGENKLFEVRGRTVVIRREGSPGRATGGRVGVIAAGTSDIPVAEEAEVMASEMGCEVVAAYDVGAAGVHMVLSPLREMISRDVDTIVVVAGREGALPRCLPGWWMFR